MSEEKNTEVIVLKDEEGKEISFLVEDEFEFEDKSYLVLYVEDNYEDAYLFTVDEDVVGNLVVMEVVDEDEFNRVSEYYDNELE